jgi:hypothetical protein
VVSKQEFVAWHVQASGGAPTEDDWRVFLVADTNGIVHIQVWYASTSSILTCGRRALQVTVPSAATSLLDTSSNAGRERPDRRGRPVRSEPPWGG